MCLRSSALGSFLFSVPGNLEKIGPVRGKRHPLFNINLGLQNVFKIFVAIGRHVPRLAVAWKEVVSELGTCA